MNNSHLPQTPKELFKATFFEKMKYGIVLFFVDKLGIWKRPIYANGDLEKMSFKDIAYWLYKTTNPTKYARKRSNLESYFHEKMQQRCSPPQDFKVEQELTISSVGDLITHPYLENSPQIYQEIKHLIFDADISMANLECSIFSTNKKFEFNTKAGPPLHYTADQFNIVKGHNGKNYDFIATACNHSLDFGEEGVTATIRELEKNNISFNGINKDEDEYCKATIINKKGFKIGIFAHTFGTNAYPAPSHRPHIINHTNVNDPVEEVDFSQIKSQINFCKKENVDYIIAHLHWGMEHEFYPTPEQVDVGHHLAELGIDCIIGHHPHVIQPYELYQTKRDPKRFVPIFYSLGNLINSFSAEHLCLSYVANLTLVKGCSVGSSTLAVYPAKLSCAAVRQSAEFITKKIALAEKSLLNSK